MNKKKAFLGSVMRGVRFWDYYRVRSVIRRGNQGTDRGEETNERKGVEKVRKEPKQPKVTKKNGGCQGKKKANLVT